ncbi:uncharacterized protein DDB_G0271670-like [Trichogramma pretiosum]|uniref:uncharacterized protein DDB_G0271670-like n=1 Tax=Trichogramma pretiosum TaxID=7493 RepID=UPI0006C995A6|nr:uncharacterized protein DDB_G0271670-like [Trichogramma pretiosum]
MKRLEQTSRSLFLILLITAVLAYGQDEPSNTSNTKTVAFHDPSVDATVKSALENGSVSEVVVRKDLLLFPVNAPDLVIAHRQEIHAVPHNGSYNADTGKPTAAEVAEVNEYSLSQLVPTNDTDNETETHSYPIVAAPVSSGNQNNSVLEPGKLLEIVSGFNLSHGMATEKVELPSGVQNFSFPKQTIVDLLSKSLAQSDSVIASSSSSTPQTLLTSYRNAKRSVDSDESKSSSSDESNDSSEEKAEDGNSTTIGSIVKRSAYYDISEEDGSGSDEDSRSSSSSVSTELTKRSAEDGDMVDDAVYGSVTEKSTTTTSGVDTTSAEVKKRSVEDEDEDDDDDSDEIKSTTVTTTTTGGYMKTLVRRAAMLSDDIEQNYTTERYNPSVERVSELRIDSNSSGSQGLVGAIKLRSTSSLTSDEEDMDVAEDIVFRPLFRYRQEMRVRQREDSLRAARSRQEVQAATTRRNYHSYGNDKNYNNDGDGDDSDYSDGSDSSDYE